MSALTLINRVRAMQRTREAILKARIPVQKGATRVSVQTQGTDLARWADDFVGFCGLLDIIPKGGTRQKLTLNRIQHRYCDTRTPRDIILKPRQVGMTTLEQARDVWTFLTKPGARVVVVCQSFSDHTPLKSLSANFRVMFEGLAASGVRLNFRTDSTSDWVLADRDASLRIVEAGASEASADKKGRAGTITRLHLTETAFYEYAENTLNALLECVPGPEYGTEIVSESTPNGAAGVYYDQYIAAAAGKSGYKAHFFPWFDQDEYRVELAEDEIVIPETKAEEALAKRHAALIPEQLKWYRNKVAEKRGNHELVDQEYPTDAETAFLLRGGTFFDRDITKGLLSGTRDPIRVEWGGELRIYAEPATGHRYIVTVDPSEGTGGDPGAAAVHDRASGEHVATLHGQFPPWTLGERAAEIGWIYNEAMLVIERNNHGHAVIQCLERGKHGPKQEPYRNLYSAYDGKVGWYSTEVTRSAALDALESAHRKGEWSTPDRAVLGEFFTFIVNPKTGKPEGAPGAHDDLVMVHVVAYDVLRKPVAAIRPPKKREPGYRLTGDRGF